MLIGEPASALPGYALDAATAHLTARDNAFGLVY
jgi:hypothetical protein